MKTREAEESLPVRRASSLFSSSGSGPGLISWVGRGQGRRGGDADAGIGQVVAGGLVSRVYAFRSGLCLPPS